MFANTQLQRVHSVAPRRPGVPAGHIDTHESPAGDMRPAAIVRLGVKLRGGASLLEQGFVLLIIVSIIGGALAMANAVLGTNTVSQETQTLNNLASSVVRTKTPMGFDTATNGIAQSLDLMNLIPSNVSRSGTGANIRLKNSWGGDITIAATNGGASFSITYTGIPKADCTKMVLAVKAGLMQSVNTGDTATGGFNLVDITSQNIAQVCPAVASNTVTWDTSFL